MVHDLLAIGKRLREKEKTMEKGLAQAGLVQTLEDTFFGSIYDEIEMRILGRLGVTLDDETTECIGAYYENRMTENEVIMKLKEKKSD